MARSGLANLITELRGFTEAGTAEYTVAGASFWTDDQMQDVLDLHRSDLIHAQLDSYPVIVSGGTLQYFEYRAPAGMFEATSGGTSIFYMQDSTGATAGTSLWTADYRRGVVTFASNTAGTVFYLTGRTYDLNAAAADIWKKKAGHYAPTAFDFSTDNHNLQRSQIYEHCLDMASRFDGMSKSAIQTVQMYRSDTW
jgi:hypothetical protein